MQNNEKKGEFISDIVGKISKGKSEDYTDDMPTFDLGQQILSQQRKIASMKRKSPGSSAPAQAAAERIQPQKPTPAPIKIMSFQTMVEQPMSPQQRIIADIVAREILVLTSIAR